MKPAIIALLVLIPMILGVVAGYLIRLLVKSPIEKGKDGYLTVENKTIVLRLAIPVQELLGREYVSLKVNIPELDD